ncbi:MAG: TOBE domain-containing protein [Bdellovibrionota bacterium]
MKVGARNKIEAEVTQIKKGDVMCAVKVKLHGTDIMMSSVMTTDSLEEMGIKVGDKVHVYAKAVNVLLGKD